MLLGIGIFFAIMGLDSLPWVQDMEKGLAPVLAND
jgi:hypothetical protein